MTNRPEKPEVVTHILGLFHLDKLCVKCGGPIEVENLNSCKRCDFLLNLKVQLEMIETGCMSIRYKSGLGKRFRPNERQQQQEAKPAPKKRKASPKKKTATKRKATPRKKTTGGKPKK